MAQDTIVVTGAGHGIGRATAQLVAEQDVNLVLADANEEWLATTASHCEQKQATVLAVPFDQRSRLSIDQLFERVDKRFGKIDALANVVGVYPSERVTTMSDELWNKVILTNLTGVFHCCRAALSRMLDTGGGSIVNVASILAAVPERDSLPMPPARGGSSRSAGSWPWKLLRRSESTWWRRAQCSRRQTRRGSHRRASMQASKRQRRPIASLWPERGSRVR